MRCTYEGCPNDARFRVWIDSTLSRLDLSTVCGRHLCIRVDRAHNEEIAGSAVVVERVEQRRTP